MFFVRTASHRDLPQIREILVDTWHATYDGIHGVQKVNEITSSWHSIEQLTENIDRPHSEFLVADDGETLAGMTYATQSEKTISLHQLYVRPEFHGQKIGLQLLIEVENAFMDCDTIALEVDIKNTPAIMFYEKYGFKKYDETANCGEEGSNIPALLMRKPIYYAEE